MRVLFDANVIIDFLLKREPFYELSAKCINLAKAGEVEGFLTAITLCHAFYFRDKRPGVWQTLRQMEKLCSFLKVAMCDHMEALAAMSMRGPDFEDNLQAASAHRIRADYMVTRDVGHYHSSPVTAVRPEELPVLFK